MDLPGGDADLPGDAYPVIYYPTQSRGMGFTLMIIDVIIPYFTSIIVRTYSWMVLLGRNGLVTQALLATGLIREPLPLMCAVGPRMHLVWGGKMLIKAAILAAFVATASVHARTGTVTVTFVQPEKYTDASLDGDNRMRGSQPVLADIRAFLEALGTKTLKPDQNLAIEVTDIDLAGRCEPWRSIGHDVRIMRDVDPPSMKLHYKLTQGSRIQAEGRDTLVDVNYLNDVSARPGEEPLRYDKAMLAAWFKRLVHSTPG